MCALVTGVQTCALPILNVRSTKLDPPSVPLFLRLNRAVGAFAQQSSFLCPILCVYQKRPRFAEVAAQLSHYRCPELLPARSCSRRESARIRTNLQFLLLSLRQSRLHLHRHSRGRFLSYFARCRGN